MQPILDSLMISEGVDFIKILTSTYLDRQASANNVDAGQKSERGVWSWSTLFATYQTISYTFTGSKMVLYVFVCLYMYVLVIFFWFFFFLIRI